MLIIPGINKFACLLTIKTRNSRMARNVLWLLPLLLPRTCTFPCHRLRYPLLPCWFLPLYFPSPFRRRIPLWFTYCDVYIQRFVYVAIRLFPHKYLTPFWKSHLHTGTKCVWYHYCRTPTFNRPSTAMLSTRRIPLDTVFHNIYILSLVVVNSNDSGCYANHEIA